MDEKYFVGAADFLYDSFLLGKQIFDSGFRPNYLVGIWRGGTPPGIAVQEFLAFHGVKTDHIPIRTTRLEEDGFDKEKSEILVVGLDYLINNANCDDSILFVDDIFDKGKTMKAVIDKYRESARRNAAEDIRIATVYVREGANVTNLEPDYFVRTVDRWTVLPHELQGLNIRQIREGKGDRIANLLEK